MQVNVFVLFVKNSFAKICEVFCHKEAQGALHRDIQNLLFFFFFCHFSVLCRSFWLRFSTLLYNLTFEMIRPRWISTKNDSNSELRRALLSYHSVWFSSHPNGDGKIPFSVQDAGLDLVVKQARWDSKILQAYQVKQIFSATVVWKIKDYSY